MVLLKPFSESKPICATWLKSFGAPIILLSMPPFFFLEEEEEGEAIILEGADDFDAFFAYLWRSEIFLNKSDASDSDENAKPIMHSWRHGIERSENGRGTGERSNESPLLKKYGRRFDLGSTTSLP